jgi:PRTRC genetic system protein A
MMGFGGKNAERACVGCSVQFRYWGTTEFSQFCFDCRKELGIMTDADARQIMDIIELIPVTEWEKQQEESVKMRNERKPVWKQPLAGVRAGQQGETRLERVGPPPNPANVAAAIRSQIQYGLTTEDNLATVTAPTAYVLAKNGLFEMRHVEQVDIILQLSDKPVLGLVKEMKAGVKWNIPRMPYEFLRQTVALFRETCKRKGGSNEAFVRVWWNLTTKQYSLMVPDQHVSGGGVHHTDTFDQMPSGEWVAVADIHSHGSGMSAFFSGVDDHDEKKAPEGRICGVIGKVNQPLPEWKWRLRTREGFIELKATDCFDFKTVMEGTKLPFTVTLDIVYDSMMDVTNVKNGEVRLFCPVDPFHDATCPEEWHAKIGTRVHGGVDVTVNHGAVNQHGWGHHAPRTQYVFIRDGNTLVEWEVQGNSRKTTGKTFSLAPGMTPTGDPAHGITH